MKDWAESFAIVILAAVTFTAFYFLMAAWH